RSVPRVCFFFTHNSETLAPAIVATERNAISKSTVQANAGGATSFALPRRSAKYLGPRSGRGGAATARDAGADILIEDVPISELSILPVFSVYAILAKHSDCENEKRCRRGGGWNLRV